MAQPRSEESSRSAVAPAATPAVEPYPSSFYAWYCVVLLLGVYINSFLDRQILGLLVGPIRTSTGFSDSDVGLLAGPAFAVLYIIGGLPIGWLVDRMSRRWIVFLGQLVWTLATFGFGLGNTMRQMLAARVVVGAGEATLGPSAYSMIADLFPPERLGRALSAYGMGIYIGGGLAYLVGGYALRWLGVGTLGPVDVPLIGPRERWQLVFFVIALPTIPLSLLLLTLREPVRRGVQAVSAAGRASQPTFAQFFAYARANAGTLLLHNFGFACLSFSAYGSAQWNPEYLIRIHGVERANVGIILGYITILAGPAGILFGGWLGDRLTHKGYVDAKIRVGLCAALAWAPFGIGYALAPTLPIAATLLTFATFIVAMPWGAAPAAIQDMMPPQMRGQASALYLFVVNLLGLGFGPYILAIFTDYVFQDDNKIHYSLVTVGILAHVIAITCLLLCLPRYRASVQRLRAAATRS